MKYQMEKGENTHSCMRFAIYRSIKGLKTQDCESLTRWYSHHHLYGDFTIAQWSGCKKPCSNFELKSYSG